MRVIWTSGTYTTRQVRRHWRHRTSEAVSKLWVSLFSVSRMRPESRQLYRQGAPGKVDHSQRLDHY
ncbi:hypothetical protein LIA77_00806 [Sarocladium implicatum]|nr:hypothetical protein LIA77_00806 [Sarocladium implicatum]